VLFDPSKIRGDLCFCLLLFSPCLTGPSILAFTGYSAAELVPESILLLPQPASSGSSSSNSSTTSRSSVCWVTSYRQGSVTLQEWDAAEACVHTHFHIQPSSTPLSLIHLQHPPPSSTQPGAAAHCSGAVGGTSNNATISGVKQDDDLQVHHVLALDGVRCFLLRVSLGHSPSLSAELVPLPDTAKACSLHALPSFSVSVHSQHPQTAGAASEATPQHLVMGLGSDGSWHLTSLTPDCSQEYAPVGCASAWANSSPAASQARQRQHQQHQHTHAGQKDSKAHHQQEEVPSTSAPVPIAPEPAGPATAGVEQHTPPASPSPPSIGHLLVHAPTRSLAVLSCHTLSCDGNSADCEPAAQKGRTAGGAGTRPPKQQGTLTLVDPLTGCTRGSYSFPQGATPLCATSWVAQTTRVEAPRPRASAMISTPYQADSGRGSPAGVIPDQGGHTDEGGHTVQDGGHTGVAAAAPAPAALTTAAAAAAVQAVRRDGARRAHGTSISAHPLVLLDEDRDSEGTDTPGQTPPQQQQPSPEAIAVGAGPAPAGTTGGPAAPTAAAGGGAGGWVPREPATLAAEYLHSWWAVWDDDNPQGPITDEEQQGPAWGGIHGPDMAPAGSGVLAAKTGTQGGVQADPMRLDSASLDLIPPQLLGEFSQCLGLSNGQPKSSSTQELIVVGTRRARGQGGLHVLRVSQGAGPVGFVSHQHPMVAAAPNQHQRPCAAAGGHVTEAQQRQLQVEQVTYVRCPAPVAAVAAVDSTHVLAAVGSRLACLELQGCKLVKKV
jgi:hypothetical protein